MAFGTCGSIRDDNAPLAQEVEQILIEEARQRHVNDIRRAIVAGVYDGIRGGIVHSFDKTRFQSIGVSEIRLAILTSLFAATANPAAKNTGSVPDRRPRSWPPPNALVNICVPRFT